jgi:hypothetical protein
MPNSRIAALAFAADVTAVIVFAAVGRLSHGESGDLLALLGTAAPFLIGLIAAWVTPAVRAAPTGWRAGTAVLLGSAVLGLLLRAGFTGRLPLTFAVIAFGSLAVLLLGWRALSVAVAHGAAQHVR